MKLAITGGTGSLGRALVAHYLPTAERLVVVSRDEVKQGDLADRYGGVEHPTLRLFLGDVRDEARLVQAFGGCDTVIHTAALKRITQSVYSPSELIKTNVMGTGNVIAAAIKAKVGRVLVISSDKAVQPTNLYGKTKAVAEDYAVQSNTYAVPQGTRVSVLRYGNVMGSRGSVWELWQQQRAQGGPLTITDPRMTRFLVSLPQAVALIERCLACMEGGEIFVPILPAAYMTDVAKLLNTPTTITGLRPGGEKFHEWLLAEEEHRRLHLCSFTLLAVIPSHHSWRAEWPTTKTTLSPYTSARCATLTETGLRAWFVEAGLL